MRAQLLWNSMVILLLPLTVMLLVQLPWIYRHIYTIVHYEQADLILGYLHPLMKFAKEMNSKLLCISSDAFFI